MAGKDTNLVLDGDKKKMSVEDIDVSVLSEAGQYHIDLDRLEVPDKSSSIKKISKTKNDYVADWADLDVKLTDIVKLIFDTANYPVFIVQDDNLIYVNQMARTVLNIARDTELVGHRFLELVNKSDWTILAENIGEMLTLHNSVDIRFGNEDKIKLLKLWALYLSDIEHFSFILLGEPIIKKKETDKRGLYDDDTGLPTFFLFEDRLQMAVMEANFAAKKQDKNVNIAVIGVSINNLGDFKKLNLEEVMTKRIADNLVFNLPKIVTVSRGLRYNFWILLKNLKDDFEADYYIRRIKEVLDIGVSDNFIKHDLSYSIGYSIYPTEAHSARELVEQTMHAVNQAQEEHNTVVRYKKNK